MEMEMVLAKPFWPESYRPSCVTRIGATTSKSMPSMPVKTLLPTLGNTGV